MKDDNRGESIEVSREAIATLVVQAVDGVEGITTCPHKASTALGSRVKREFVHMGVKVIREDDSYRLSLCIKADYGLDIPAAAREVRGKIEEYLRGLADVEVDDVEIIIDDIEPPA